jgi:hypothetical protein
VGGERRREKSLRNGVRRANAVVRGPVYRTRRHVGADGGAESHERVLHDDALRRGETHFLAREVVYQRVRLLPRDVVAGHDDVELGEALRPDDAVDDFLEAYWPARDQIR